MESKAFAPSTAQNASDPFFAARVRSNKRLATNKVSAQIRPVRKPNCVGQILISISEIGGEVPQDPAYAPSSRPEVTSKKPASLIKCAGSVEWVSWRHIIPTFRLIICTCTSLIFDVVRPSMFHDVSTKWAGVVCKFRPRKPYSPRKFTAADSQQPWPDPWMQCEKLRKIDSISCLWNNAIAHTHGLDSLWAVRLLGRSFHGAFGTFGCTQNQVLRPSQQMWHPGCHEVPFGVHWC